MATPEELQAQLKAASDAWDAFANNIAAFKLSDLSNKFTSFSNDAVNSIKHVSKAFSDLQSGSTELSSSFSKIVGGLSQIVTLTSRFDGFKNMSLQGGAHASTMVEQFDLLVSRFGSFEKAAKSLAGSASPALASAMNKGEAATRAFLEHASSAEHLEQSYLNLLGATGNLNKAFDGVNLKTLDDEVGKFNILLQNTAGQSNKTLSEIGQLAVGLGKIPGAMDQVIKTGGGVDDQLTSMVGVLRLAAGAQRDVTDVVKAMDIAYENLSNPQGQVNDNMQKGAQFFALMSEASQKLGLRFSDTQGYLEHISNAFKNIGDNTQGATNILARFTGALQSTGLTAKASVDVVQGMVDSIKNLEMGTKALISARSGGPGGLQGAFQVENLLRQGKVDQVAKMTEQALRQQFNGRIYTQEEAARSPQAASQFLRQRTLLQSSAFGGLARDADTATRLLEALKQGPMQAGSVIKESMSAVKETTGRGNEIQQRQYTVLNKLNSGMDRLVSLNEMRFKIDARTAIGTTAQNEFADALKTYQDNLSAAATEETKTKEPLPFAETYEKGVANAVGTIGSSIDAIPQVGALAADTAKGAVDAISDAVKQVRVDSNNKKITEDVVKDQIRTRNATINSPTMRSVASNTMAATTRPILNIPKIPETVKHQIEMAPVKIQLIVEKNPDLNIQAITDRPKDTTITTVNRTVAQGGLNNAQR